MSLPREFYVVPGGGLGIAPAVELKGLRRDPLQPIAGGLGTDGIIDFRSKSGLEALEIEVVRPGDRAEVRLLDSAGSVVVEVVATAGGLVINGPLSAGLASTSSAPSAPPTLGPSVAPNAGYLKVFYDRGICEAFSPAGEARAEIFYGCPPIVTVAVGRYDAEGLPIESSHDEARCWELAGIW